MTLRRKIRLLTLHLLWILADLYEGQANPQIGGSWDAHRTLHHNTLAQPYCHACL